MADVNDCTSVKLNGLDTKIDRPSNIVKTNQITNGNQMSPNGRQLCPGKVMHVMTPGPKKCQNVKKSPDKEPKFVPYEPYKAAVRSIVPELSQPSIAVFKRKLSTASNCSKASNVAEDKDVITVLAQEKQVLITFLCRRFKYF